MPCSIRVSQIIIRILVLLTWYACKTLACLFCLETQLRSTIFVENTQLSRRSGKTLWDSTSPSFSKDIHQLLQPPIDPRRPFTLWFWYTPTITFLATQAAKSLNQNFDSLHPLPHDVPQTGNCFYLTIELFIAQHTPLHTRSSFLLTARCIISPDINTERSNPPNHHQYLT